MVDMPLSEMKERPDTLV